MGLRNDYRVSKIVVLCKDCGQDVGLYPARHQCTNVKRPYLPTLCSTTSEWSDAEDNSAVPDLVSSSPSSNSVSRQASDSSMESGKWSLFKSNDSTPSPATPVKNSTVCSDDDEQETSYFDSYATHLKTSASMNDINGSSSISNGKKLWGRMKENEKWKELLAAEKKKEENKSSGKLWERIIQATMSSENQYHDSGPDSDKEDWEGETHVSRILREYHESKYKTLPHWLCDDRGPRVKAPVQSELENYTTPIPNSSNMYRSKSTRLNGRRLWQSEEDSTKTPSAREREIQALRASSGISRTKSERMATPLSGMSNNRPQRSSLRNRNSDNNEDKESQLYGSTAPRRANTLRSTAPARKKYYLDQFDNNNNIPLPASTARPKNYF